MTFGTWDQDHMNSPMIECPNTPSLAHHYSPDMGFEHLQPSNDNAHGGINRLVALDMQARGLSMESLGIIA